MSGNNVRHPIDVMSKIQCHSLPADRDFFMSAQEAVEYGLVDAVISKPALLAASAQNGA